MRLLTPSLLVLLSAVGFAQTPNYTTTELMQNETRATVALLEKLHISKKEMASVDTNEVLKTYFESLDPAKMYFTQKEVDEFTARYGKSLDLYLQRGNLTPAFEIYKAFKAKVALRTDEALAALNGPVDLNQPGVFPTDRRKGAWPASDAEADDLWARRLRLDILSELLGEDKQAAKDAPKSKPTHETTVPVITPEKVKEAVARLKKRYEKIRVYLTFDAQEVE